MTLTCTACNLTFETSGEQRAHYKAEWHRYNLKRKVAGLGGVSEADYERRKEAALIRTKTAEPVEFSGRCHNCKKNFLSQMAFDQHRQSKKHRLEVNKHGNGLERLEVNGVMIGEEEVDVDRKDEASAVKKSTSMVSHLERQRMTETNLAPHAPAEDSEKMDEGEEEVAEGEENLQNKELTVDDVSILDCIFCNVKGSDLESMVAHMQKEHGFFIPDIEYLVDIEGLLKYLSCKVKIGRICLYCNGKGKSFKAYGDCQKHMLTKFHCKLRYEEDNDLEEYAEYYDFSSSYEGLEEEGDDAEKNAADVVEEEDDDDWETDEEDGEGEEDDDAENKPLVRRTIRIADNGELVLLDGRRAGLREFQRYYRQHLRPNDEREQVLANSRERLLLMYKDAGVSTKTELAVTYHSSIVRQIKARLKTKNPHERAQSKLERRAHKLQTMSFR